LSFKEPDWAEILFPMEESESRVSWINWFCFVEKVEWAVSDDDWIYWTFCPTICLRDENYELRDLESVENRSVKKETFLID
jgi:hypothetical protein